MKVHFFAMFRQVTGQRLIEVPVPPGGTVRALIDAIVARYPGMREQLLDAQGHLHQHVHVIVNGRDAPFLPGGLDMPLGEDDEVKLFPPVGGG